MTSKELIYWCTFKNFEDPVKVAALLSIFDPDEEEDLEKWEIEESSDFSTITINDTEYEIKSEQEAKEALNCLKENVQEQLLYETTDVLKDYINWEEFWKHNNVTIESDLDLPFELNFEGTKYYYNEYVY